MKHTQLIDALRNIKKQAVSFLSVGIIAMLAVISFLAITYSVKALNTGISEYYKKQNYQDFLVLSHALMTEEDLAALVGLDGVETVEGVETCTAYLRQDRALEQVNAVSMPDQINLPLLLEGRLPDNADECLVEKGLADGNGLLVGSAISLEGKTGGNADLLALSQFTVTGIFQNPENTTYEIPVTYDILLSKEAFDQSLLDHHYVGAKVKLSGVPEDRFSTAYRDQVKEAETAVTALEKDRKNAVEGTMVAYYEDQIRAGEERLAAAQLQMEEANKIAQASGLTESEAVRKEYEDNLQAYEEYSQALDEMKGLLDQARKDSWIILDNSANAGYLYCKENAENLQSICFSFSLIFIIVGALVIFATISRMIEEHSRLVGTTKALGFYEKEILSKYMFFGQLSTIFGVLLGIASAYFLLHPFILSQYARYYTVPAVKPVFILRTTLLVVVGSLLLCSIAVRLACSRLLKINAVSLLSGENKIIRRKNRKTKNDQKSLYTRLILLNMTSDMKRVVVTIVSIAGCCILMMVGFSMKFAMDRVPDQQYGRVMTYDAELLFDSEISPTAQKDLSDMLDSLGATYIVVNRTSMLYEIPDGMTACTAITADQEEIRDFYHLFGVSGEKKEIILEDHGVAIPKRMHEEYSVNINDSTVFLDAAMERYEMPVTAIFDNYIGNLVFFSPAAWEEIFGSPLQKNCFFIKTNGLSLEELQDSISRIPGFLNLKDASSGKQLIQSTAVSMTVLIVVMIAIAAVMSYFILINLTGSYMIHKKKELTIMRINGFSTPECIRYAATELVISTIIGILLGIVLGRVLSYLAIRMIEQSYLQMVRTIDWRSVIFSSLITACFSLIVNSLSLHKIRHLKLSDV